MQSDPRSTSADDLVAHAQFLRRLCRELVGDAHAAEDLAQETLIVALERPPQAAGPITGWLATVAKNLARNARRGHVRRAAREQSSARSERIEGEELALECLETQREISNQLLMLPADQRTVLYLRYYEGLSPVAIATRLQVPVKTIKSRHTRALAVLRERLDARSGGDRTHWMTALAPLAASRGIGPAGTALLGGWIVKKWIVAAALVLLAALGVWMWNPRIDTTLSAVAHEKAPALAQQVPDAPLTLAAAPQADQRDPIIAHTTAGTGTLELHLSWSDGQAAANIGLDVVCAGNPSPREEALRAVTDAQGVALVAGLHPGSIRVTPDMREPFESAIQAGVTSQVTHTLEVGVEVTGRVVDSEGVAVTNASIWCGGALRFRAPDMKRVVDCAADGTFVLRDIALDAMFDARAAGHRPSACFRAEDVPAIASGKRSIEIRLGERGGRVTGIVLDPDGKPLERARVLAGARGGTGVDLPSRTRAFAAYPATVETGADGRFELIDDLEPGQQPIYATARGFPVWEGTVDVLVGAAANVEIRLSRPARISGRVIGLDGNAVSGVKVIAAVEDRGGWYWTPFPASQCISDPEGGFVIDWVSPGQCELNASDYKRPEIGRAHALVACAANQTANADLHLESGNTIAGRVEDQYGAPIAGWTVDTQNVSGTGSWYERRAITALDGSFTLLNVGPGRSHVTVRAPGTVGERARANAVPAGATDVVLVVKDAREDKGTLQGRIVDPSGRVLDDVILILRSGRTRSGQLVEFDAQSGRFRELRTAGRYHLSAVRGTQFLYLSDEFTIAGGEVTDLGDLVFPAPSVLEITLTFPPSMAEEARENLDKLGLRLMNVDGMQDGVLEAHAGVWTAEGVLPGRWLIEMWDREFCLRGAEVDVREGVTTRVNLSVEPAVTVAIAFKNPGPLGFTVEARDDAGKLLRRQYSEVRTTSPDAVLYIGLPVGRAKIEVSADGGSPSGKLEVDVTQEELRRVKPLRLRLELR